jgi:hypothetical protein
MLEMEQELKAGHILQGKLGYHEIRRGNVDELKRVFTGVRDEYLIIHPLEDHTGREQIPDIAIDKERIIPSFVRLLGTLSIGQKIGHSGASPSPLVNGRACSGCSRCMMIALSVIR